MIILRYLLFPFSLVYKWVTFVRNFLYDVNFLKSCSFEIPVIAVGNLSVGGTGKTPQIEYLIRLLIENYTVATLSRGYKRKSKGFILANTNSNAEVLGDEPFQIYEKFPKIVVAVDANRKKGIERLLKLENKPEVILLDDAFQHRKVKAGFYILLSSFDDIYFNDFLLPTGNLREGRSGSKRANVIIITKCPKDLSEQDQKAIKNKINLEIPVFFSFIDYDTEVYNEFESKKITEIVNTEKVLIAGIAKPKPFFEYLNDGKNETLEYPDHHHFTKKDIEEIKTKSTNKLIITTEKDYVRLKNHQLNSLFYLPIKSNFISNSEKFNQIILNYVTTNSAGKFSN